MGIARAGPVATAFRWPNRRTDRFGTELNYLRVSCVLAAMILGTGIVTYPGSLIAEPPIPLVQIISRTKFILGGTIRTPAGEARSQKTRARGLNEVAARIIPATGTRS